MEGQLAVKRPLIHPTAVLDPECEIAPDVEIGPYCVIGPRVRLGAGTKLHERVSIPGNTVVGERNVIFPGAALGAPPQDKKFRGEDTWLRIGDGNTIREYVTIHRGTQQGGGETQVGNECFLMVGCHIAHDCRLGNRITMANCVQLGGHVHIEDGVGIGGLTAIHHFVSIGQHAFVAGMTRVVRDAPPFMITEGQPSRVRAVNRVGLARSGFPAELLEWLKECHRLLYFERLLRPEAHARLRERGPIPPPVAYLLEFLARADRGKQGRSLQP